MFRRRFGFDPLPSVVDIMNEEDEDGPVVVEGVFLQ